MLRVNQCGMLATCPHIGSRAQQPPKGAAKVGRKNSPIRTQGGMTSLQDFEGMIWIGSQAPFELVSTAPRYEVPQHFTFRTTCVFDFGFPS